MLPDYCLHSVAMDTVMSSHSDGLSRKDGHHLQFNYQPEYHCQFSHIVWTDSMFCLEGHFGDNYFISVNDVAGASTHILLIYREHANVWVTM